MDQRSILRRRRRFFFSSRRRHTRCLSDWSSDVCSSDLVIAMVGGAAAAWPLAARAQADQRMRRIGVLVSWLDDDPAANSRIDAFQQEMQLLGWVSGRNRSEERRVGKEWGCQSHAEPTKN